MRITERDNGIVAVDTNRRAAVVDLGGNWRNETDPATLHTGLGYDADETRRLVADSIRVPPVAVTVIDSETGDRHDLCEGEAESIDERHLLILRTAVLTHVCVETAAEVRHTATETTVDLQSEASISLGFESRNKRSAKTLYVDRSVEGVATALTALSPCEDTTPDRTWPALREQPPSVEFSGVLQSPNADSFDTPDTDIELLVPESDTLSHLFPASCLAYYLDATVNVEDVAETTLRVGPREWSLGETPDETDRTASEWLRWTFYLDCYARSAGPHGEPLGDDPLEDLGLDAQRLYELPLADRVNTYLDLDSETLDETLPQWHLGVHVSPEVERLRTAVQHLGRLADIYAPDSARLTTGGEQVEWSHEKQIRGTERPEPNIMIAPDDTRAPTVGWDNGPSDVWALGAYNVAEEPVTPRPLDDSDLSVTVVRASAEWRAADVIDRYRKREQELPLDVTVVGSPTPERLAEEIASDTDLLHVIAHHEPGEGLKCRDGYLTARDVDECGVETAFINACDSLDFCGRLVDLGAAAAVGTTRTVTDDVAAPVGDRLAWLLSQGWAIERAVDLVRRVHDPSGYVTIGDGTHVVNQSDAGLPPVVSVEPCDGKWRVEISHNGPRRQGRETHDGLANSRYLGSRQREYVIGDGQFAEIARRLDSPVLYDGELVPAETIL
jgi:hypothetical protein